MLNCTNGLKSGSASADAIQLTSFSKKVEQLGQVAILNRLSSFDDYTQVDQDPLEHESFPLDPITNAILLTDPHEKNEIKAPISSKEGISG